MIIGLHGTIGSGKDTVFEQMTECLNVNLKRVSFAEKLKESVASLFGISLSDIEELKRDKKARVEIYTDSIGDISSPFISVSNISFREMLQRYGTESHRDVFGDDFWVEYGLKSVDSNYVNVFTDVRFENEARAIRDAGGKVFRVVGSESTNSDHPSEAGIPDDLVDDVIYNTCRHFNEDGTINFVCLQDEVLRVARKHAVV